MDLWSGTECSREDSSPKKKFLTLIDMKVGLKYQEGNPLAPRREQKSDKSWSYTDVSNGQGVITQGSDRCGRVLLEVVTPLLLILF